MSSKLFSPYSLRGLTLENRLVVSPMCQYSAKDGCASSWHTIHVGSLLNSGAGLFIFEATAVESRGRITPHCLGLWSDENADALHAVLKEVRRYSAMPVGVQLNHAGRKASAHTPFIGKGPLKAEEGAWPVIGPSAVPFAEGWQTPTAMTRDDMLQVIEAFVAATKRAERIGIDLIEIHAAHGYLLSAFLSPLANQRQDAYGGSLENRMRFPLEVFDAVRRVWPEDKPIGVRCNGTDWHPEGIQVEEAGIFAKTLREHGCDYIDVSSGGNCYAKVPVGPSYQVPYAQQIREHSGLTTIAVGLITDPQQAEEIVASGKADLVAIGRAVLNNPHWPWQAAETLDGQVRVPWQYFRAATRKGIPPPYVR
jgi:2,4-dienoyl-CoA reductase-like NADH-dependent reductase (Old Yellow Enzyme family)